MIDIMKRSGLLIPTTHKNENFYIRIKEHLERRTKEYNNSTYTINTFYLESESFLLVPRNFPIHKFISNANIHDHSVLGDSIKISHNIIPRSDAQLKSMEYLLKNDNGILQLDPGVGKTVITIYMIAERKRKSFILVHRDSLADQWKERLLTFTDLKSDDISRLRSNSFVEDLKKPIIISTDQTFVSLLKRFRSEFLTALNKSNIGIFVADEVHTSVGAPTFAECSIHIPAKCTYGLSATPYRFDGNGDIIEFHLGPVFSDDDVTGTMDANVNVILLDFQIDTPKRYRYIRWGGAFQRSRYLNLMKKSIPFMNLIKGLLTKFKDDRHLICMIERINLIEELHNWIPSTSKSKFCGSAKMDTLSSKVTFTTPGKCRDGIDAPWKDCIIMTSPISNIKQLTGRVVRAKDGKKKPVIIDLVDYGCKDISQTFINRLKFYDEKNWQIQFLLAFNGAIKQIDRQIALELIERKK